MTTRPTVADVNMCMFPNWYPNFKDCTMRSRIIPLPDEFVAYMQEDGCILPTCPVGMTLSPKDPRWVPEGGDDDSWADDSDDGGGGGGGDGSDSDSDSAPAPPPEFAELETSITEAIAKLGGNAMPKLNWSSPRDAGWVGGGLKCETAGQIFLLLKSSDFVSHDLAHAFELCRAPTAIEAARGGDSAEGAHGAAAGGVLSVAAGATGGCAAGAAPDELPVRPDAFVLVLRRWCNLNPAMEFRCFVREGELVGVCQRECSEMFDFLTKDLSRGGGDENGEGGSPTRAAIVDFFHERVRGTFGAQQAGESGSFVMDVFVDRKRTVWVIDFNPWGRQTNALLFDWGEPPLFPSAGAADATGPGGGGGGAAGGGGGGAAGAAGEAGAALPAVGVAPEAREDSIAADATATAANRAGNNVGKSGGESGGESGGASGMSEYERLLAEAQGGAQGGAVADPPPIRSIGVGDELDRDDWKDAAEGAVNGAVKGAVKEGEDDGESGEGGSEGSAGGALGHDGPGISEELPDEFEFRYVAHRGQTRSGTWYESNGLL